VIRTPSVLHLVARLNVGGPAIQVIPLVDELRARGYAADVAHGQLGPGEASMTYLADTRGLETILVPQLRRAVGPHDAIALREIMRLLRARRPDILHTHTAKAGALGRVAAHLLRGNGPRAVVHTYHGHVFSGYFSPARTRAIVAIEGRLARYATRILTVSDEIGDDIVSHGIAPRAKVQTMLLGLELDAYDLEPAAGAAARSALRDELGIGAAEQVVTIVARLVPIKRVDRFLRVAALVRRPGVRYLIVGDGDQGDQLRASAEVRMLGDSVIFAGFRRDMPAVCAASDIVVQTSDNEGTPVSLIEAGAAGLPCVSTDVGGVRTVVEDGVTGHLRAPDDDQGLADAIGALLDDPAGARSMGERARERCRASFSLERLVDDSVELYGSLLEAAVTVSRRRSR
jgi:glycosyltransferase involved in cell wall biosynthesis